MVDHSHEKKGIIIFSTAYHPFIGGAELAIEEITKHIHDYQFFLITARLNKELPRKEHVGNVLVYRVGIGIPFIDKLFAPLFTLRQVYSIEKKYSICLYWSVMVSYVSITPLFMRRKNKPLLLTLQEGDSEDHIARAKLGVISFAWYRMMRRADHIQVISTHLSKLARTYGYTRDLSIIPNGVNRTVFAPEKYKKNHTKQKIIITTSRLVEKNGIDILLRAFAIVRKTDKDVQLCVVGDGNKKNSLQELAKKLHVDSAVSFVGSVPFRDIPKYLSQADIFVRPSRSEGLGTSFLEAMAMGLPVVGTRIGGIPDFLEDGKTGLFSAVNSPEDTAKQIMCLFSDKELYEMLSKQGKNLVEEKYSWNGIAKKLNTVFIQLTQSNTL